MVSNLVILVKDCNASLGPTSPGVPIGGFGNSIGGLTAVWLSLLLQPTINGRIAAIHIARIVFLYMIMPLCVLSRSWLVNLGR